MGWSKTTAETPTAARPPLRVGLVLTGPIAPLLMITSTVGVFILGSSGGRAIGLGALIGAASWLLIASVARSFSTVERANRSVHRELTTKLKALVLTMNDFLEWALGYGYIRVRADLNRADEAALLVAPLNRLMCWRPCSV